MALVGHAGAEEFMKPLRLKIEHHRSISLHLYRSGNRPEQVTDEGFYADVARDMIYSSRSPHAMREDTGTRQVRERAPIGKGTPESTVNERSNDVAIGRWSET